VRAAAACLALAALTLSAGPVRAADPTGAADPPHAADPPRYEARVDPFLGAQTGALDVASAVTALGSGEAALFRDRVAVLRVARTIVWDAPVAWWFGVVVHEAFGHGGRAREFNAAPGVHLGTPWEGRVSYATFDATGKTTEELLGIYAGGTEANTLTATLLEHRALEDVRMRSIDLLFLASSRLVATRYVLFTTPDPRRTPDRFFAEYSGGGDVANYLGLLHTLHSGTTGVTGSGIGPAGADPIVLREYDRLRRQAWWNALDPGLWWALGSALRQAARGDDAPALPLPRTARFRHLPILSSEWTPSGGGISLEWAMTPLDARPAPGGGRPWLSFVARRGRGPSGSFGAIGAATGDGVITPTFAYGGAVEVWDDPRNGPGGGFRVDARLRRGPLRGLFFALGVKSQGFWIGEPRGAGLFGGLGVRYER
jgi:hypothetical protein